MPTFTQNFFANRNQRHIKTISKKELSTLSQKYPAAIQDCLYLSMIIGEFSSISQADSNTIAKRKRVGKEYFLKKYIPKIKNITPCKKWEKEYQSEIC
jgi:hypothetical protein